MRPSDKCWSQSHVNSISQIAPMYHNVLAQTSQINFLQQQQQQQQQQSNQQQPMQSQQYYCYPANQQGSYQNQYGQSYQQDPYVVNQPPPQQQQIPRSNGGNIQSLGQQAYNVPAMMQNQAAGYGSFPVHILDQIRPYIGTPAPIFILPNNCPSPIIAPQVPTSPGPSLGCPGIGINCPSSPIYCPPNSCYPYPMAVVNPFSAHPNVSKENSKNCGCSRNGNSGHTGISDSPNYRTEPEDHRCTNGNDDTVCTRKNCPSSINLQALASQLLAIQGIISCAATRLVLRKVPGSNVSTTIEDTMERAKRSLNALTQEQLLTESRQAQQVNALINLHMTANPPANIIPILTTVQLKINLLKAHVDSSINRRLSESQGVDGADGNQNLDPVVLALKSDQELRDLLATLRQKECDERVNLNFAPYQSQRVIAESRLINVQNKISGIETEMERRRNSGLPRSTVAQQFSDPGCGSWYGYTGDISNTSSFGGGNAAPRSTRNYDSPDPFRIQVRNPKRLNLRPHVGSPETTYERPKKSQTRRNSRSRKDTSDDEDCEDNPKNTPGETNETRRCTCEKSSEDESGDEAKKKLGGKILAARDLVSMSEDDAAQHPGISIIKLSPNLVIVVDNSVRETKKRVECKIEKKAEVKNEMASREMKIEVETEKSAEPEVPYESKSPTSVAVPEINSDKTASVPEKAKKFKWGKKKDKFRDQTSVPPPRVEEKAEIKIEENNEAARSGEDIVSEKVDYTGKSEGPEPVREQTVRMITKIDYEPSVAFGAFLDSAELPVKDKVIEERYKGSFTEDSLKSASTESTVDQTPDSLSLRVEDYETAESETKLLEETKENLEISLDKEVQIGRTFQGEAETIDREEDNDREAKIIVKSTKSRSSGIHRSHVNNHNDENAKSTDEQNSEGDEGRENSEEMDEDIVSGDLSTIGNHVASFGSIIGKIAALKLHRVSESSDSLFADSSAGECSNAINPSVNDSEGSSAAGRGNSTKNDEDARKEIGRWKYIKFAEIEESIPNGNTAEQSTNSETSTYVLPKIKHSVIEDKSRGEKYVVIEEPRSEDRNRRLGEPYRTGRSLLIRSRLKSPQSSSAEESGPFTLVKSPKHRDKNCLPLRVVTSKSSVKNRTARELKSSDKFWIRPDGSEADEELAVVRDTNEFVERESPDERCKFVANESVNESRTPDSVVSVVDERVVEIHDYSKIRMYPRTQPGSC